MSIWNQKHKYIYIYINTHIQREMCGWYRGRTSTLCTQHPRIRAEDHGTVLDCTMDQQQLAIIKNPSCDNKHQNITPKKPKKNQKKNKIKKDKMIIILKPLCSLTCVYTWLLFGRRRLITNHVSKTHRLLLLSSTPTSNTTSTSTAITTFPAGFLQAGHFVYQ